MIDALEVSSGFCRRVGTIPAHSLGLSVDVYAPDLTELVDCLTTRGLAPGYLEIFKATTTSLDAIRHKLPGLALAYHGEGLWITQPESHDQPVFHRQVAEAAAHQNILQSLWLNHECATKQMAGYSFGTYLPPLYTPMSAAVAAENIGLVQAALDAHCRRPDGSAPLLLLEMPPLTYFAAGTISIPKFFRLVTQQTSCGLVLDMGHLWTVYRYTDAWRQMPLERFVQAFLDEFPLERVVEIHVAGLACHETARTTQDQEDPLPEWIDAHAAPIPPVLWSVLEQVLGHRSLVSLRGVALEVDTKPIALIVDEFEETNRRFAPLIRQAMARRSSDVASCSSPPVLVPTTSTVRAQVYEGYERYARIVSGLESPSGPEWEQTEPGGLQRYRTCYLPYEILHWGGDLTAMFPRACRVLARYEISLDEFVIFWSHQPRPVTRAYDFFLLKIERFLEFVEKKVPLLAAQAEQEADLLQRAYAEANDIGDAVMEPTS